MRWALAVTAIFAVLTALGLLSRGVIAADRAAAAAETVRLALYQIDAQAQVGVLAETGQPPALWSSTGASRLPIPVRARHWQSPPLAQDATPKIDQVAVAEVLQQEKENVRGKFSSIFDVNKDAGSAGAADYSSQSIQSFNDDQVRRYGSEQELYGNRSASYGKRRAQVAQNLSNQNSVIYENPLGPGIGSSPGPWLQRWETGDLLLERRWSDDSRQMTRIDWPVWERALADAVADLLPSARLIPVDNAPAEALPLASIRAVLLPGAVPAQPWSAATCGTLAVAWLAGVTGLVAVLWAWRAALQLAARRAAFVSAVTHELRTPLTALRLHGDLLADERVGGDGERRARAVAAVRGGAARLGHLVDNVLDYARLERRRPQRREPLAVADLDSIARSILGDELLTELPTGLCVLADIPAVERIVQNLADNARKYGRPPYILAAAGRGRQLAITLRDHGPGLAADARTRLFEPFARSAEAAAGEQPGVGLGLALCRRLARDQGGDLTLATHPDGGCLATLSLPAGA